MTRETQHCQAAITAPSTYSDLHAQVCAALGPNRNPILLGFDGRDGHGKTSAATWLAWQLGMSAIHLDLFIRRSQSEGAISWRTDDLARCLQARDTKPIIIEGVLLLDALSAIEKSPDYLVFVEKAKPQHSRDRRLDDVWPKADEVFAISLRWDQMDLAHGRLQGFPCQERDALSASADEQRASGAASIAT